VPGSRCCESPRPDLDFAGACLYIVSVDSKSDTAGFLMARTPVLAAGGIVLRREDPARIAVVRLRKRNEWVLPKGKLDDGETPRAAAEREVLEETGHDVSVHEFLGTLVYESGGRSKVVHYWRMEADGGQVHELMHDVKAVDWLPLGDAVERLSRAYERAFLENVGPLAVQAAAHARAARRSRAKQPAPVKRRSRPAAAPQPLPVALETPPPQAEPATIASEAILPEMPSLLPTEPGIAPQEITAVPTLPSNAPARDKHANVMRRAQDWLRRVIGPDRRAASGR
jgi:8-oxo-dGTP diphosphatase